MFGIASHPDFSLEPLFIVGSIQMSWATHEYGFPIIECANSIFLDCSLVFRKGIKYCRKIGRMPTIRVIVIDSHPWKHEVE